MNMVRSKNSISSMIIILSVIIIIFPSSSIIAEKGIDQDMVVNEPRKDSSSYSMYRGDQQRTGRCNANTSENPGTIKWKFQPSQAQIWSSPVIGPDGVIYFGSADSYFYAVNPNGTMKWKFKTGNVIEGSGAVSNDGIVYFGSMDNYFYAVYTSNGTLKWKFATGDVKGAPVISDDGIIYVDGGDLFALYPNGTKLWNHNFGVYISSPAIGHDGTIYIGSYDDNLYAIYQNGTVKWKFATGDNILSTPAIDDNGIIYFGSWDGYLYALHPNGTEKWSKYIPGQVNNNWYTSPAIDDNNNILIIGPDGRLYKYSSEGKGLISISVYFSNNGPSLDINGNFALSTDGTFFYLYYENGSRKFRIELNGASEASPSLDKDGNIFITDISGTLYCIGGKSPVKPDLHLKESGDSFVHINWTQPEEDNSPPILEYRIYRKDSQGPFHLLTIINGNIFEFNDTTVQNGLEYQYHVNPINKFGESEPSNIISATPMTLPDPPRNVQINSGNEFIELTWNEPEDNGGAPIENYLIYKLKEGESWSMINVVGPDPPLFYNDTDVFNGISYQYYIRAENEVGLSEPSQVVSSIPKTIPLNPIFFLSAGDGFVNLLWYQPSSNGGSEIVRYTVFRGTDRNDTSPISVLGPDDLEYNDTEVENGVTYFYWIQAENEVGGSKPTQILSAFPKGKTSQAIDLRYEAGNKFVHVYWNEPENDNGAPILTYVVDVQAIIGTYQTTRTYWIDAPKTEYNDTDVINGQEYTYTVKAVNSVGSSLPSEPITATPTSVPSPPIDLHHQAGDSVVEISWMEPDENGGLPIQGYRIYRQKNLFDFQNLIELEPTVRLYNDTTVENGEQYTYYVVARNERGLSAPSNYINANPFRVNTVPSSPRTISYTLGHGFVLLNWQPPLDNGGAPIDEYRILRGTSPDDLELISTVSYDSLEFNDTSIEPETRYYYSVVAINSLGASPGSEAVSVTTLKEKDDPHENGDGSAIIWIIIIVISVLIILSVILFLILRNKGIMKPREQAEEKGENEGQISEENREPE